LWGQGLVTEACALVVDFGFHRLGLHRIWADHPPDNLASERILEKLGFQREGVARGSMYSNSRGEWCDMVVWAILEDEWRGQIVSS
jgi:RimJ/RimL family protein N-acetyltransferase